MIYNTTHRNNDFDYESNKTLGKPFSFLKKIKMNGIGSSRLIISKISKKLLPIQFQFSEINYANIELRPNGVIIHFTNRLERYSWIIPYYKLIVYNTNYFSIHANENSISFLKDKRYLLNKNFIKKMANLRISYLNLDYYDGFRN